MLPLTQMFEPEVERMARATPPGMAHWALGGPPGATCKDCVHFDMEGLKIKSARCLEYSRVTRRRGQKIPPRTPACKYFKAM